MRVLLHDYGGYAFVRPLSVELARRGHDVDHAWCGSIITTPAGDLVHRGTDPPSLRFTRIDLPQPLCKDRYLKRRQQERHYGELLAAHARDTRPDVILSGNTPLDAQGLLLRVAQRKGTPFVFWLQDLLGLATKEVLSRKLGWLGQGIGRYYERMESKQLRQSTRIVAISDRFTGALQAYGVGADRVDVQENWADLGEIQPGLRDNSWSASQNLGSGVRFLYAGNLGKKQDPSLLLVLARDIAGSGGEVTVISQGTVADELQETAQREKLANFRVLPFQPAAELPQVLAASDVLVALLDSSAGAYCVPSKILTYLAAGRPILASLPHENPSFQLIERSQTGFAVDAGSTDSFRAKARLLLQDAALRQEMGHRARETAEQRFDMVAIANHFEQILLRAVG